MFIKKDFDDITVQVFEEKYRDALNQFELSERQQIYSSLPQTVLDDALKDENRIANVALNKEGKVVGFFVLHRYYQHEGYDTPNNVVYVRSLSVNEKFQGHGYGTKMMMFLPEYVQALFPDFTHLYLVVDAENQSAWNVYSLRLKEGEVTYNDDIHVINLLKDDVKVGFIALEQNDNKMNISAIEVNKKNRNEGIAESALRQLPTYIRKQFEDIEVLSITLYGERNELKPLCLNSNFVAIEETEDYTRFEKYINY